MHRVAWGAITGFLMADCWFVCMDVSTAMALTGTIVSLLLLSQAPLFATTHARSAMAAAALLMTIRILLWGTDGPSLPEATTLLSFRDAVNRRLTLLFPEPHAAFMAGLLTGERSDLPLQVRMDMQRTGLTHILAISGFNITLVLLLLDRFLFFIPRNWKLLPLAGGIITFTLFTGASSSVNRACIMGILNLLALHLGRISQTRLLIGWTAAGMTLWNPAQLSDDAGFQLSFLAVIGLAECTTIIEPWMRRVPRTLGIREALASTVAAQLTAAPWAAYVFGTLPLHSPLLNILIAPLLPLSMLSGAVALIASLVSQPLGLLCALPGWLFLSFILSVAHLGAMTPVGIISGLQEQTALLLLWYGLLAWFVHRQAQVKPAILGAHAPH